MDPRDDEAVERVFTLKGRRAEKALLVVGASLAQLERLVVVPAGVARPPRERHGPRRLTVVLPTSSRVAAGRGRRTLAVRVPSHDLLRALLELVGPLTATSANLSGGAALAGADEVAASARRRACRSARRRRRGGRRAVDACGPHRRRAAASAGRSAGRLRLPGG